MVIIHNYKSKFKLEKNGLFSSYNDLVLWYLVVQLCWRDAVLLNVNKSHWHP